MEIQHLPSLRGWMTMNGVSMSLCILLIKLMKDHAPLFE